MFQNVFSHQWLEDQGSHEALKQLLKGVFLLNTFAN